MKKVNFKRLIISLLIPLSVGTISGLISMPFKDYGVLIQPPLAPPGWLFPVVWTILYILMGISFYLILESNSYTEDSVYVVYFSQLLVNGLWSIFFFAFKWRLFSIFWLLLLIVLIVVMIEKFYKINKWAGLLQTPYLIWCCFAIYLNIGIYLLN
ncbi:MAG: tryptophan-rich sensory protein [Bacilli bacterium]|nr:tryptophan-rich sensory protein [Bacilli bacterium]